MAVFSINSFSHEVYRVLSIPCIYGYYPSFDPRVLAANDHPDVEHRIQEFSVLHEEMQLNIAWADNESGDYYSIRHLNQKFKIGERVLSTRHINTGAVKRKFDHRWIGRFEITHVENSAYTLLLPKDWRGHDSFNDTLLRPFTRTPVNSVQEIQYQTTWIILSTVFYISFSGLFYILMYIVTTSYMSANDMTILQILPLTSTPIILLTDNMAGGENCSSQ